MTIQRVTPILNVSDVPASLAWFESLGWSRSFSWNAAGIIALAADRNEHGPADFAGVCCESGADLFMTKDGQGPRADRSRADSKHECSGGVWMSWWLRTPQEVDSLHQTALDRGYEIVRAPFDAPWGVREFHLRHPDGHTFRVSADLHPD